MSDFYKMQNHSPFNEDRDIVSNVTKEKKKDLTISKVSFTISNV